MTVSMEWRLLTRADRARLEPPALREPMEAFPLPDYEHVAGGKLPRNHVVRAYRLAAGPDLAALVVVQHSRMKNVLEVRCTTAAPAATREMLRFLFAEAVRSSGRPELHFMRPRGSALGALPANVVGLAARYGVVLEASDGRIPEHAGRSLWMELCGFSAPARDAIRKLQRIHEIDPARICFLVDGGCWSLPEMESILLGCTHPELLLGCADGGPRHQSQYVLEAARAAVLGGALDRHVAARAGDALVIDFDPVFYARIYRGAVPAPGWRLDGELCEAGREWHVQVRTRIAPAPAAPHGLCGAVLFPADFHSLPGAQQQFLREDAARVGLAVLTAPDSMAQITTEARRRLSLARMVRA